MSKIEWCDRSDWNPIRGCTRVSEGCRHCYAEQLAGRFSDEGAPFHGFATRVGREGRWTGKVELIEERLTLPLKWRKPAVVFVNSAFDLFHEALPDSVIDRVFAVLALAPQHKFLVLTKRAKRMREWATTRDRASYVGDAAGDIADAAALAGLFKARAQAIAAGVERVSQSVRWPLPHVHLGVSVENQPAAERIPELLATPAAGRFVSAEPVLGEINLRRIPLGGPTDCTFPANPEIKKVQFTVDALTGAPKTGIPRLDGVICGGESGPGARPLWTPNVRAIVKQCRAAGVACFVKQLGSNVQDRNDAGFDGENYDGLPASTEWPDGTADRVEHDLDGTRDDYQGAPVRIRLRDRKGGDPAEWPEDLRVRQLPWRRA